MSMSGRKNGLVIAIDGPSGAGKSTIAGQLAAMLGYVQIDTGAMYRAVAYLISQAGFDPADNAQLKDFCADVDVRLEQVNGMQRVIANGQDVTAVIRTPEMSLMTSRISALQPVREAMVRAQRAMGRLGGVVLEGRDIGTVVFPDADLKFFLSATTEERGRRRYAELITKGEQVTLEETIAAVALRDEQDTRRELSPLIQADDAIMIDSSCLSIEQVLHRMASHVREKSAQIGTII